MKRWVPVTGWGVAPGTSVPRPLSPGEVLDPPHVTAAGLTLRGDAFRCDGRLADAAIAYTRAVRRDPTRPEALVGIGLVLAERGEGERAIDFFAGALGEVPEYRWDILGLAVPNLAEQYLRVRRFGDAHVLVQWAMGAERRTGAAGGDLLLPYLGALALAGQGAFAAASEAIDEALTHTAVPGGVRLWTMWRYLRLCAAADGDPIPWEALRAHFPGPADPRDGPTYLQFVRDLWLIGHVDVADALLDLTMRCRPGLIAELSADELVCLGDYRWGSGDCLGAEMVFTEAIERAPDDERALRGAANIAMERRDFGSAIAYIERIVELGVGEGPLRALLGILHVLEGDLDRAECLWDEVGEASVGAMGIASPEAWARLVIMAAQMALRSESPHPRLLLYLGDALRALAAGELAEDCYRQSWRMTIFTEL